MALLFAEKNTVSAPHPQHLIGRAPVSLHFVAVLMRCHSRGLADPPGFPGMSLDLYTMRTTSKADDFDGWLHHPGTSLPARRSAFDASLPGDWSVIARVDPLQLHAAWLHLLCG